MENKVAIVTGGSRGIGAAIVRLLAENNYTVILNYNKSETQAMELANQNSNIHIFQADISNSKEVIMLINYTYNTFGRIDLLVNNAGIDLWKTIDQVSEEEYDSVMNTNLKSAFIASREVTPYMIKQHSGSIINISSIWGITGASCETVYSISKAGLDGLTKSLAKELAPSNVRVNSIAPGIINTDMNNNFTIEELEKLNEEIPLGKIGEPDDIAKAVLFLLNNEYITGQILQINGGWNI